MKTGSTFWLVLVLAEKICSKWTEEREEIRRRRSVVDLGLENFR